ncbi:MAG: FHA domain-containing protein [Polyangiaceae bacterium]|nr:FHA domain-containing protein [Polyangiaceae bacterium]
MRFRLRYQHHNLELAPGHFVIGRSTDCQLSLDDPLVSRRHARLVVTDDSIYLEDLGSRNGVLVSGAKVEGKRQLVGGDRFTIGSQEMVVIDSQGSDRSVTGPATGSVHATFAGPLTVTSMPALKSDQDEGSRKADAFKLLGAVADKALAMGKADEAERILGSLLGQLIERARAGAKLQPEVIEQAARYAARLAGATGKGSWVDYTIELFALHQRVVSAVVVDELYVSVRRASAVNLAQLRAYLAAMKTVSTQLSPNERFLLQRVEGLEKLAALR